MGLRACVRVRARVRGRGRVRVRDGVARLRHALDELIEEPVLLVAEGFPRSARARVFVRAVHHEHPGETC